MKLFLKNITTFLLLFYTSLIILATSTNYIINKKANFKLEDNITMVLLGNSQAECAYNDSLISNFKNLGRPAETYFYIYPKLKKILEQNPQIEDVYIEFSTPNILIREDQKIWRDQFLNNSLPIYFSFLESNDHLILLQKNPIGYQQIALKSLTNNLKSIFYNNFNYNNKIGGYGYLKREKVKAILDTLNLKTKQKRLLNSYQLATYDLYYLEKMIKLCQQKNKNIFLIRSPYHKQFYGHSIELTFKNILNHRFENIPFIDLKDFPLSNDEFGDLQHLNYKGARKFSKWFNTWLKNRNTNEFYFYDFSKN